MECDALREDLIDVLYGEASPAAVRRVEEHQAACPSCREEMAALHRLRGGLTAWKVPPGPGATLRRRAVPRPAWLAAAAAVVLALGAGFVWSRSAAAGPGGADVRRALEEQEARHHLEIEALKASFARSASESQATLLNRMEDMIRESEARQTFALEASLADFSQKAEAQRRYDLAQVSAGLSYLDGKSGLQAARTAELMGHVLLASQKR